MTVDIILHTSKTLKDGSHPVVIRLTEKGKRRYKNLGREFAFKISEWNFKKQLPKPGIDPHGDIGKFITDKKKDYTDKLRELKADKIEVSMDRIIELVENPTKKVKVYDYFDQRVNYYHSIGKVGTASVYKGAKDYLKSFHKKDIYFAEINYSFLTKYETMLRKKGLRDTTISIQFRTLRALYNEAINDDNVNAIRDNYPFEKFSISKRFNTDTIKRALSEKELNKIKELNLKPEEPLFEAWQYFMFGYYALGINFVDIANLRWKDCDFEQEIITYERQKKKKKKTTTIPMLPQTREILLYQKQNTNSFNKANYVFPILNKDFHITPMQRKNRVHKVLTRVNKDLKEVAIKATIEAKLTTYVWRHTMASELQRKLVSIDVIKELMNHRDTATTETYLEGLSKDVHRKEAMKL